jgi:hypothetical protein
VVAVSLDDPYFRNVLRRPLGRQQAQGRTIARTLAAEAFGDYLRRTEDP